eukprot:2293434-Rhodomonas_salina.1
MQPACGSAGGQIEVILKAVEERQEREERDQDLDETQTETSSGSSMLDRCGMLCPTRACNAVSGSDVSGVGARSSLPPSNASRQPGSARSASPLARMANGGVRGLLSGVMDQVSAQSALADLRGSSGSDSRLRRCQVAGSMLGRRWARELQQLAEQVSRRPCCRCDTDGCLCGAETLTLGGAGRDRATTTPSTTSSSSRASKAI